MRGAALAIALALAAPAARAETIVDFEAAIQLARDDAFTVSEHVRYDFGPEPHHGIFRLIPVRYGRGQAADYRIDLTLLSVTDRDARPLPHRESSQGAERRIRIGDPDRTVSGVQDYWIRYRVRRGLLYFQDHDELYWNVTGNGWPAPIEHASARVELPPEAAATGREAPAPRAACFTGPQGAVEQSCRVEIDGASVRVESTRVLAPGEGLTLVVGLPKGVLIQPSELDRLLARLSDWLNPLWALPLLTLAGLLAWWRRQGRDPAGPDAVAVRYEPPAELTPAEVGTLVDERVDLADLTASILDLAVRGYLRIEALEARRFLFLSDRDWRLVRLKPPDGLRRHEVLLMERLFADGAEVKVSDLKERFYKNLPELREALYEQVTRVEGLFASSPERVRNGWLVAGGAVAAAGVALGALAGRLEYALPVVACGGLVLAFAPAMPRRTRKGRRALDEVRGYREFLARADRDRIERAGTTPAALFERGLPFALVLGVADAWAESFADLYLQPPDWYRGTGHAPFAPRVLVSDLGRSMSTLASAMSATPPSRGGSGSSGFGGGGFSGGGFGGGGGGSW